MATLNQDQAFGTINTATKSAITGIPGQTLTESQLTAAPNSSTDKSLFYIQGFKGNEIVQSINLSQIPTLPNVDYDTIFKLGIVNMHKDRNGTLQKTWLLASGWASMGYSHALSLSNGFNSTAPLNPTYAGVDKKTIGMTFSHYEFNPMEQLDKSLFLHTGFVYAGLLAQRWSNYKNRVNLHYFKAVIEALETDSEAKSNVLQLTDDDIAATNADSRFAGITFLHKFLNMIQSLKTRTSLYGKAGSNLVLIVAPHIKNLLAIVNAKVGLNTGNYQEFDDNNLKIGGLQAEVSILLGKIWPKGKPGATYTEIANSLSEVTSTTGADTILPDANTGVAAIPTTPADAVYMPTYSTAITGDLGADLSQYIAILQYISPEKNSPVMVLAGAPYVWSSIIPQTGNVVTGLKALYGISKWKGLCQKFLYGIKLPANKTIYDIGGS